MPLHLSKIGIIIYDNRSISASIRETSSFTCASVIFCELVTPGNPETLPVDPLPVEPLPVGPPPVAPPIFDDVFLLLPVGPVFKSVFQ